MSDFQKLPSNFNLPPGVTPADIERNAGGDTPLCEECEKELITDQEIRLGLCNECADSFVKDGNDEDKNTDERQ